MTLTRLIRLIRTKFLSRVRASGVLTLTVILTMVAPGYGYGIVAMAALGYGGPQSLLHFL